MRLVRYILGVALMFGGMYVSANWHPEFHESLAKQGIPLDFGKTVAVIGVFLILFDLLNVFFFKALKEAIDGRTHELETTFSEAESLRAEMMKMRSEYEARLNATEASARAQIQDEIRKAQEMRQQLMSEASAKADEFLKKAQEQIEMDTQAAINQVRTQVVNLTLGATEKILGENVDSDRNRKLIDEFLTKVEVPS